MDYIEKIKECISDLEEEGMLGYIEKLLEVGEEPIEIVNRALIPGIENVGALYQEGEYFIPELLYGLEIMNQGMDMLLPYISKSQTRRYGNVVIGTVEGDTHDIGKNIVKVVLESYGYQVIDLGKDVPSEIVLDAYHKYHPKAIGLSALMTTTVVSMEETITLLKQEENMCPIFVGVAVLTEDIAQYIHADYYTKDAMAAVNLLNEIVH